MRSLILAAMITGACCTMAASHFCGRFYFHDKQLVECQQLGSAKCEQKTKADQLGPSYSKMLIFIRHGQYNLKGRTAQQKVLTELGWKQAYEAGRYLKRSGIRVDRIVHSDMIRARQTTAGILVGLQDECDVLMDSPVLTYLAAPTTDDVHSEQITTGSVGQMIMLGTPYSPYPLAPFDCQESRFLTEGPPPVAPEPPSRKRTDEKLRSCEGRRLDGGFLVHVNRIPVTLQGLRSYVNALGYSNSSAQGSQPTNLCETIVFVGHANVFRFWLCRALRIPAEAWLRFTLCHGSISSIIIRYEPSVSEKVLPNQEACLEGCFISAERIGEVGHLPGRLLTH